MKCLFSFRHLSLLISLLICIGAPAQGQWSRNPAVNTPVSTARANQTGPVIVSDGASGAIITWQDTRDSATRGIDLYAQRLNSRGIGQWTANGIVISRSTGNQTAQNAVPDGRGGYIVVWQDTRNGNSDIYAQHIGSDSTKLWTGNGTPICTEAHEQTLPVIAPDNLGGAFIVWQDYRNGNADLYAQHINSGGTLLWATDGVPVVTAANDQILPSLISDGNSGAIVAWQDLRNGLDFDIYAQDIQSSGTPAWTANGVPVAVAANHQRNPVLTSDGSNGAFICWEDYRNDIPNVYIQRINSSGSVQLTANGIPLSASAYSETQPRIIADGLGGAIAVWTDLRDGDADIFAQRVNSSGAPQWAVGGLAICSATGVQKNPVIVTDAYNGVIVAWEDYRSGGADVYAQRVLSNGSFLWAINGVGIATDPSAQTVPAIVDNGAHGAILSWQDARNSATLGSDIYAQLVNDIGTLGGYSIHGVFFNDLNQNGVHDSTEPYVAGWIINLTGPTVKIDTTDATGAYSFDGLATGIYTLQPQIKTGWIQTSVTDSIVNLSIGGDSIRNYGVFRLGSISGMAFKDKNHDGVYQTGEKGDANRVIHLSGAATMQSTTDVNGLFSFVGLQTGTYYLAEDTVAGYLSTTIPPVDTVTIDSAGQAKSGYYFGCFQLGKVSGTVYNDLTGDSAIVVNSKYDSTVSGWEVRLYRGGVLAADTLTNTSGGYLFANLDTGKYVVRENLQTGWFQTYPKPPGDTLFANGERGYRVGIDSGGISVTTRDFGNFRSGMISGLVFNDVLDDSSAAGDPGLAGWCVKLYSGGVLVAQQYTDNNGVYRFANIVGGNYTLEESLATQYSETYPALDTSTHQYGPGAGPRGYKIVIANGKSVTANFGNFRFGTIRGRVLLDVANDSMVIGDPPVPGWLVRLSRGSQSKVVATDADGAYSFTVDAGHYVVEESVMVSSGQTYPRVNFPNVAVYAHNKRVYTIAVDTSGETDDAVDFGITTGYIGGVVFNDQNGDGVREDSEPGLAGVPVFLGGKKTDIAMTDATGKYFFVGLDAGTYYVSDSIPAGWTKTYPPGSPDYIVQITGQSTYQPGFNFGHFMQGSIGGTVYFDRDSNAVRDPRDPGLSGWYVTVGGRRTDTIMTDGSGHYLFSNLTEGVYWLKLLPKPGWKQTSPHDSTFVTISSGVDVPTIDFGVTGVGRISGMVYNDLDRNAAKGAAEPGIAGWPVVIQTGGRIDTVNSDAGGNFMLTRLGPGDYTIQAAAPPGWLMTYPAAAVYSVTLPASGTSQGNDYGEFALGQIGGTVFSDDNASGTFDSLEHGIPGVRILLTGARIDSVLTGSDGSFTFMNLDTGSYVVQERNIPFVVRSVPKTGNSYTDAITAGGQVKKGRNFGHFQSDMVSGGVFNDLRADAVKDSSDPPLNGWRVHLHRTDIAAVDSVIITGMDGVFQFTGVPAGRYVLATETPAGWYQTLPAGPDTITLATPGQQVTGKYLGYYFTLFSGKVFNDFNGDGVNDPGEPGRGGLHLFLVKNGTVIDSTQSDSAGGYSFRSRGPGTYIITQAAEQSWLQTATPAAIVLTQPSGSTFANLNFGDFQRITISGVAFEDLNRNGILDGSETGLIQCVITLKKNGTVFAVDTTLADGSYSFSNLGPGNYTFAQQIRTGYLKSAPVAPDTFSVAGMSGTSVAGKNFGNYLNTYRSITARILSDADGKFSTADDRTIRSWWIGLSRAGVLLKSVTNGWLDTANLPAGTYVVQIADSSGGAWSVLGEHRTIHRLSLADSVIQRTGSVLSDTVILGTNDSHLLDFVSVKYSQIVVRAFADADGDTATTGDQNGLIRGLEVYAKYVAPANLTGSRSDSAYAAVNLGSGAFVLRQLPLAGWQTIRTRVNGISRGTAYDTVSVALTPGMRDTVDFFSTPTGTIIARCLSDDDGDTLTVSDEAFAKWGFAIYKNVISASTRVDTAVAESLSAVHLAGSYILRQTHVAGWKTIHVTEDGASAALQDTFHITIAGGDVHRVDFINSSTRRLKTWAAGSDARWENRLNWSPAVLPTASDSILISGAIPWRVPRLPVHSSFATITIGPGAGLLLPTSDTVVINGTCENDGTIFSDAGTGPVAVINGDLRGSGAISPGNSTIAVTSGSPRSVMGGTYAMLRIGGAPVSISGSRAPLGTLNRLLGNCTIGTGLSTPDNLDAGGDTITIVSDSPGALQGAGIIQGGTLVRSLHSGQTAPYRLWDDSTSIAFLPPGGTPSYLTASAIANVTPAVYGMTWDSLGGVIDTVDQTITTSGLAFLSSATPIAIGMNQGGVWTPVLRRVFLFEATPESGYTATLKIRYFAADVPAGVVQSSLSLLRLRLVRMQCDDSLCAGWNMVSLPFICSDYHTAVLFPELAGSAFSYQPGNGYVTASFMTPGTGYWVKFPRSLRHHYDGLQRLRDSVVVTAGWNLIGTTSYPIAAADIVTSPAGLIQGQIFGLSAGYAGVDTLYPGKAYWVNASASGVLSLAPASSSTRKAAVRRENRFTNLLRIRDAAGRERTLLFGSDSRQKTGEFGLPPAPPDGVFDVRFETNCSAVVFPPAAGSRTEEGIRMQGMIYPVTVTWQLSGSDLRSYAIGVKGGSPEQELTLKQTGSLRLENGDMGQLVLIALKEKPVPSSFALKQSYPNPFNPTTRIEFDLPDASDVTLVVYDILGREVATLLRNVRYAAGTQRATFNGAGYPSGIYFYRLTARSAKATFQDVRKMMLIK